MEQEEMCVLRAALEAVTGAGRMQEVELGATMQRNSDLSLTLDETLARNCELLDMCTEANEDRDAAVLAREEALSELSAVKKELNRLKASNQSPERNRGRVSQVQGSPISSPVLHQTLSSLQREDLARHSAAQEASQWYNPYQVAYNMQMPPASYQGYISDYSPPVAASDHAQRRVLLESLNQSLQQVVSLQEETRLLRSALDAAQRETNLLGVRLQAANEFNEFLMQQRGKLPMGEPLDIGEQILYLWHSSVFVNGIYSYSIINIRDKVAHVGQYYNLTSQCGDLCALANMLVTYGSHLCINTDSPDLLKLLAMRDPLAGVSDANVALAADLVSKGIRNCRFRTFDGTEPQEGLRLAKLYIGVKVAHSMQWVMVSLTQV